MIVESVELNRMKRKNEGWNARKERKRKRVVGLENGMVGVGYVSGAHHLRFYQIIFYLTLTPFIIFMYSNIIIFIFFILSNKNFNFSNIYIIYLNFIYFLNILIYIYIMILITTIITNKLFHLNHKCHLIN